MSILYAKELCRGRRGGDASGGGRHYTRVFHVLTDDPETRENDILTHSSWTGGVSIPRLNSLHPNDTSCWVVAREAEPLDDDDRLNWIVTVEYDKRKSSIEIGMATDNPVNQSPRISFGTKQYEMVVERAYLPGDTRDTPTDAILNSALMPFDPPVVEPRSNLIINIDRNERDSDFDPDEVADYENTLNDGQIRVGGVSLLAYQGCIRKITADEDWDTSGRKYWKVHYEIEVDRDTHLKKVLDQGFYIRNSGTGERTQILVDGQPATEPRRLDGLGQLLADGSSSVFITYQTLWKTDWSSLDLPTDPMNA